MIHSLRIENPKQERNPDVGRAGLYPYYAGFSPRFAKSVIESARIGKGAVILDPWNGGGTTTWAATVLGYKAQGFDLNPAMVVIAKARSLGRAYAPGLWPIGMEILKRSMDTGCSDLKDPDPLQSWFVPRSSEILRRIERALRSMFEDRRKRGHSKVGDRFSELSETAAFFYTALFRTVRFLMAPFLTTNPTWIKLPGSQRNRLRPSPREVENTFRLQLKEMISTVRKEPPDSRADATQATVGVSSSTSLPVESESVDLIVSSPPYCTRIDYAVATAPELAVLGYDLEGRFKSLRRSLIGSTTVPGDNLQASDDWGRKCLRFLSKLRSHPSKASKTYYHKNHLGYFHGIAGSISELVRVLKKGGVCVLVVQDSYYKELHNDLAQIFIEMAQIRGLQFAGGEDFRSASTMAGVNTAARKYRARTEAVESVLCFRKS